MKKGEKEAPKAKQPNPPPFGSKGVEAGTDPRGAQGSPGSPGPKKKFFWAPWSKEKKRNFFISFIYIIYF